MKKISLIILSMLFISIISCEKPTEDKTEDKIDYYYNNGDIDFLNSDSCLSIERVRTFLHGNYYLDEKLFIDTVTGEIDTIFDYFTVDSSPEYIKVIRINDYYSYFERYDYNYESDYTERYSYRDSVSKPNTSTIYHDEENPIYEGCATDWFTASGRVVGVYDSTIVAVNCNDLMRSESETIFMDSTDYVKWKNKGDMMVNIYREYLNDEFPPENSPVDLPQPVYESDTNN